ncbi:putative B3 domain-containing protein REM9-like, partial [Capsicum annuum]
MQGTKSSSALITGNSTIAATLPIQLSDQNHPLKGYSYSTVPSKASLTILVVLINSDSVFNMKNFGQSSNSLKSVETMRLIFSIGCGVMLGLFIGISFPTSSLTKLNITASIVSNYPVARDRNNVVSSQNDTDSSIKNKNATDQWKDLLNKPICQVKFTVGIKQKHNIDACVTKFSDDFTILFFFHYDRKTTEWDEFEWSQRAIHISARKQTKWWYTKRFLHLNIVALYDYIFIWDEDLGVKHFDGREFVEIMAPVFSRDVWRCVWHMILNDLIHGWRLDFALHKFLE